MPPSALPAKRYVPTNFGTPELQPAGCLLLSAGNVFVHPLPTTRMSDAFAYDVFLSHPSKDKTVVRPLAERLWNDGVKVWFDESELPKDEIRRHEKVQIPPSSFKLHPSEEEGLERSRVLLLCLLANAFGSDWAQLESGTFRFRDPLNKQRRFLPRRLDDAPSAFTDLEAHWITLNYWIPPTISHQP